MRRLVPLACAALLCAALPAAPARATEPAPDDEFPVTLGSFATTLVGSLPARTHNVRLAAAALDGAVLRPGEELSFNERVGARTPERGYRPAPVILRETRQVQVGGGVCQVASTVFDAALLAGLSVVERHRHSSPVDYVALGQDATIAWGVKDLRIENDLDLDVRLRVQEVILPCSLNQRLAPLRVGVAPQELEVAVGKLALDLRHLIEMDGTCQRL